MSNDLLAQVADTPEEERTVRQMLSAPLLTEEDLDAHQRWKDAAIGLEPLWVRYLAYPAAVILAVALSAVWPLWVQP